MGGHVLPGVVPNVPAPDWMRDSVHLAQVPDAAAFTLAPPAGGRARVIGIDPDTLTTRHLVLDVTDPASAVARNGGAGRPLGPRPVGRRRGPRLGVTPGARASPAAA